MALNALLDIELSVPDPSSLTDFWVRRGMLESAAGVLGTEDRDVQIRTVEGTYRHMSELHLGCEAEKDLIDISQRLADMGIDSEIVDTRLTCVDPIFCHRVVVDVTDPHPLTPTQSRAHNPPGEQNRVNLRAEAVVEKAPRPPRRLGHFVLGTPNFKEATEFFVEGLGFKISDQILKGVATFMRVEQDHHNLLIHPGPTSYLNHYAREMDDVDAIGKAGMEVLAEREDASVVGVGRHVLGSNMFWYMLDPQGNMFEFFSDIDQIVDDEAWDREFGRRDWEGSDGPAGFSVWGPKEPEVFFNPTDIETIAAGREAAGLPN